MSVSEFLAWLAAPAALGIVSSWAVTAIKLFWPRIADRWAVVASIVVAAVLSVGATVFLPYVSKLPPGLVAYWPIVVWAASQLWWQLTKIRKVVKMGCATET